MKSHHVWTVVLGALLLLVGPAPAEAETSVSTIKMSMSANENYLRRFRKERAALAGAADKEAAKKMAALDQKIKNLEMDNTRLAALLEKQGAAPAAAPAAEAPVLAAPAPQAPVRALSPHPAGLAVSEWEKMTREQKEDYVRDLVDSLKKDGKTIQRHPLFYTALMDYVFVSDSRLAAEPLREAVIATIQKNEPS